MKRHRSNSNNHHQSFSIFTKRREEEFSDRSRRKTHKNLDESSENSVRSSKRFYGTGFSTARKKGKSGISLPMTFLNRSPFNGKKGRKKKKRDKKGLAHLVETI